MKRKSFFLLSIIMLSTILAAPVYAKNNIIYRAQGSWDDYDPEQEHSEILGGHWNIEVRMVNGEYVVQWSSHYRELNLGGEEAHEWDQAVGTIDHFKYYFSEVYSVSISDDTCTLEVHLMVHVKHHDAETGRPFWHWIDRGDCDIVINQYGITSTTIPGVTLEGTTHNIKY
jgi:hypothetical protein